MRHEHPDWDIDKCVAVCYDIWRKHKKESLEINVKELCKYCKDIKG